MGDTPRGDYVFDQAWEGERQRLRTLEDCLDPLSIARLEALGVARGWRCLDVGAGGGSLTQWLCGRVGAEGAVVAVDRDTRFLERLDLPNLEVRMLDVTREDLPSGDFDLVHARYLLEHLPEREAVLKSLARTARPGGLVLVMDAGGATPETVEPSDAFARVVEGFHDAVTVRGWDLGWAPTVAERMRQQGLTDVGAEAHRRYETGTPGGFTEVTWYSFTLLRDPIIATGRASAEDVDLAREMLRDPACGHLSFETWTAWGRKPTAARQLRSRSRRARGGAQSAASA